MTTPRIFRGVKGLLLKLAIKQLGGTMLKGWKAKAGAVLVAIGAIVGALTEFGVELPASIGNLWAQIIAVGGALGIYGVRDKQERDNPGN